MPSPETIVNPKKQFNFNALSKDDKELYDLALRRIDEMQDARRQEHYGSKLETIWADADKDYIPHRLKTKGKRKIADDELLGWRGSFVEIGSADWQSDVAQPNPFIKIQTALSILVDQNPVGVFLPATKSYQATTALMKQLYTRSWEYAKSKQQLKKFVFNLSKYGWACAKTYPRRIERDVKNLTSYDPEHPEKSKYESKKVIEFNDIYRESLDPWNTWIDDMAKPNDQFSLRDWCYRKVYSMDSFKEEFGKYKDADTVKPGGITTDRPQGIKAPEKKFREKELVEVFFYENILKDAYLVIAGPEKVPVIIDPLPISDARGNKKLSLWQTYWNLRHTESPYGIGIYEAIRYDNAMLDRFRNMTIDQIALSIYKMWFYQGTGSLMEGGDIKITPGVGKQVLDPKNIVWNNVPGPGADAWNGLEMLHKDIDNSSGITDSLIGTITGKTAFEIAQAKESALKRLKTPLDNITDALNTEAYITISLIQLLYSVPETHEVSDKGLIEDYLKEINGDPELFERSDSGVFTAKVYPEFPLNVDKDEKGNLVETEDTKFFRIKPKFLKWEGIINVKSQSVLTPSKQVDKALEQEMYNLLIPLLAQDPNVYGKIAKNIVKLYDKDPKDVLPDAWLSDQKPQDQPLMIPPGQDGQQGQQPGGQAPTMTGTTQLSQRPKNLGQRIVAKSVQPLRKV